MNEWLLMPVLAAAVGGLTNWFAIAVTLYPAQPRFIGSFRIQGLLPSKAERLVRDFTRIIVPDVVGLRSLLGAIDADRAAGDALAQLGPRGDKVLELVLSAVNPGLWSKLRPPVRDHWISRLRPGLPRLISRILRELQQHPERYIDLPSMAAAQARQRPELLSDIMWSTGRSEFRFIEWSGGVIGAVMGLFMALVWSSYPSAWIAVLGGAFVGGFTNWLALRMVFAPLQPVPIGPWTLQGLVYRRQREVSGLLATIVMDRMVSFGEMQRHLAATSVAYRQLCREAIAQELEHTSGGAASLVTLALGAPNVAQAIDAMAAAMVDQVPEVLGDLSLGGGQRAAILEQLSSRLRDLEPATYGRMLHFMVAEDEHLLVAAGALLGGIASYCCTLIL